MAFWNRFNTVNEAPPPVQPPSPRQSYIDRIKSTIARTNDVRQLILKYKPDFYNLSERSQEEYFQSLLQVKSEQGIAAVEWLLQDQASGGSQLTNAVNIGVHEATLEAHEEQREAFYKPLIVTTAIFGGTALLNSVAGEAAAIQAPTEITGVVEGPAPFVETSTNVSGLLGASEAPTGLSSALATAGKIATTAGEIAAAAGAGAGILDQAKAETENRPKKKTSTGQAQVQGQASNPLMTIIFIILAVLFGFTVIRRAKA